MSLSREQLRTCLKGLPWELGIIGLRDIAKQLLAEVDQLEAENRKLKAEGSLEAEEGQEGTSP